MIETTEPFVIETALERVRKAIATYPKAAMFEMHERGFTSLYAQLVGCMLSIRTLDEVCQPIAIKLLERAPDPAALAKIPLAELENLIGSVTFAGQKAKWLQALANKALTEYEGNIPAELEALTSFTGIGPKCAHLALGIACGKPYISVDIHVHRITNRWGYVTAKTPEKTLIALEKILPKAYWIEINALLVPFGKHICIGNSPRCSHCPLNTMCPRIGVTTHR